MWGHELAQDIMTEAAFASVEVDDLDHDIQNCYYVVRPKSISDMEMLRDI